MQVRAVDNQSDYPKSAPMTKLSGFTPNVEAIAAYKPDLVIISNDNGGKLAKRFKAIHIPVMLEPAAVKLADVYTEINQIGVATGHKPKAKALVARMKSQIAQIVASVPKRATPLTYYHELSPDLLGHLEHVHRADLLAARPQERGRPGPGRKLGLSAAECGVPGRRQSRPDLPGRHEVLRASRSRPSLHDPAGRT